MGEVTGFDDVVVGLVGVVVVLALEVVVVLTLEVVATPAEGMAIQHFTSND